MKKYYNTKREANKARGLRLQQNPFADIHVFKMPKGTRKVGKYAVCSYIEYLNTY